MVQQQNHYQTLELTPTATAAEIKQSYRRLAKKYHPDLNNGQDDRDKIIQINAAYEILSDARQRQRYDLQLSPTITIPLQQRETAKSPRRPKTVGRELDDDLILWLNQVYSPVNRMLGWIIKPLKSKILELSADPFDDDLMANFEAYTIDCRRHLDKIEKAFHSMPNPSPVAELAANLYYSIDRVSDGLDELKYYMSCYDDKYLHTGQELFKIAADLQKKAQKSAREFK
jgi:molecular chaperone DnaJ